MEPRVLQALEGDRLKTTEERLAMRVLNLRSVNKQLVKMIRDSEAGYQLLPGCDETATPSFREGRSFWSKVRRLVQEDKEWIGPTSPDPDE